MNKDHLDQVQSLYNNGAIETALNFWRVYEMGTFEEFQLQIGHTN
jgi:hypothetical protein